MVDLELDPRRRLEDVVDQDDDDDDGEGDAADCDKDDERSEERDGAYQFYKRPSSSLSIAWEDWNQSAGLLFVAEFDGAVKTGIVKIMSLAREKLTIQVH